jgi:type IV pilus modification protein PilV
MHETHRNRRQSGFSLLEVLVAVVVLSFGLLALAALQGSLFKSSAEAKAQSVALALATEKLEYFRGYSDVAAYQALDSGADGVDFTRSWTVKRYAYPAAGGSFILVAANTGALSSTTYAANNEFKRIQVDVTWKDAQNLDQRVSLEDAIGGVDPGDSRKLGKLLSGATPRGPEVRIYDPSQQQQGVIPIAIGGDSSCTGGACAAATNPKPLVNGANVIETRFDVMTYSGVSGNTAIAQSRVETSIVGCSCDYGNANTTLLHAKRPTYWNGYRYVLPEDATYAPPAGVLASATNQSALCTICCRDHHDPTSLAAGEAKFDPRNGSHALGHFPLNASTGVLGARTLTGAYTEACRVIRVGGEFRVAADTYDDYTNLLATKNDGSTTAYLPTTTATTNYQNFVLAYLAARDVTQTSSANYNNVLPITAPATVTSLEAANSINTQTPISYNKTDPAKWLHLRGLYVDWLEDAAIQAISDAKTNCQGTAGAAPTSAQLQTCVLKVLPFTSINLTELGIWTPKAASDAGYNQIVVANNNFADTLSSTAPVRGKVTLGSSPTTGQTTNAVAKIRRSNSGLTTLIAGIDVSSPALATDDASTTAPGTWSATQPFTIQGSGGVSGVNFNLNFYAPTSGTSYPFTSNTKTPSINDAAADLNCNGASNAIACSSSVVLPAQSYTVGQYNYATTGTSTTPISCSNGVTTVTYTPPSSNPYQTKICRNYAVSSVALNGTTLVTGPLTQNGTDGVQGETTTFTLPSPIVTNDVLGITFGTPVDTVQPLTCSYSTVTTCNNGGHNCTTSTQYTVTSNPCP